MKLPRTHITLTRVLVLALAPSLTSVGISIYNTVEISHDRAQRRAQIDQEICAVVARLPGDVRKFEANLRCPVTTPTRPTPTRPTVTPHATSIAPVRAQPSKPTVTPPSPTPTVIEATRPGAVITSRPAPSPSSTRPSSSTTRPPGCIDLFRQLRLC